MEVVKILNIGEKEYSHHDIQRYFGSLEQVAGIQKYSYTEGRARGMRVFEIRTGSGMRIMVLPDRGLDIGLCEYQGIPFSFRSAVGESSPAFFEADGEGWMRNFTGGLLTTCGLTYLGSPCEDEGKKLGLHGRISNIPAESISSETYWKGDQAYFKVRGKVRETKVLDTNMVLYREISTALGSKRFLIKDEVINEGFQKSPHMFLYHFNLGHPLLDKNSYLVANSKDVVPRDKVAAERSEKYDQYLSPTKDYPDTVYYHQLIPDGEGYCQVALINDSLKIGLYLRYKQNNLPNLIQWKFTGEGNYVAGLEPANCLVEGRAKERERGTLQELAAGEKKEYEIEVGLLTSGEEIIDYKKSLRK